MISITTAASLFGPLISLLNQFLSRFKNPRLAISLDIPNCVFSNIPEGLAYTQPHSGPLTTGELVWGRSINWTIKMTIKNNSSIPAYNIKWEFPCQRGVKIPQLPQQFSLQKNEEKEFDLKVEHFAEMNTTEMRYKLRCGIMPYFLDYIQLILSFNKESGRKYWLGHVTSKHGGSLNVQTNIRSICIRKIRRFTKKQK